MERVPKRPRAGNAHASDWLQGVLHTGGISNKGLGDLLKEVKRVVELPAATSMHSIEQATVARFNALRLLIPMKKAGTDALFEWELVDPSKLVAHSVAASPALANAFSKAMAERPASPEEPWRCIVAFDEFAPGNKLQVNNRRKVMVLSFTFAELGQTALMSAWGWFTAVALRSSEIHDIEGGWSACLAALMGALFMGTSGLATAGIPLALASGPRLLFASQSAP